MARDAAAISKNMSKIRSKDTTIDPDYWVKKIERNRSRDCENDKKLLFLGYTVIHFWGKDILRHTDECLRVIEETIWDIRLADCPEINLK